jgi:hypothetical protein
MPATSLENSLYDRRRRKEEEQEEEAATASVTMATNLK